MRDVTDNLTAPPKSAGLLDRMVIDYRPDTERIEAAYALTEFLSRNPERPLAIKLKAKYPQHAGVVRAVFASFADEAAKRAFESRFRG